MEDILEELVGEIYDGDINPPEITQTNDNQYEIAVSSAGRIRRVSGYRL